MASMELIHRKNIYYNTRIYKVIMNEENDKIELERIYNHRNEQTDVIISINKIPNKKLIFVTSSQYSDLEIVKTEI